LSIGDVFFNHQSTIDIQKFRGMGNEEHPPAIQLYESRSAITIGSKTRLKRAHSG
jgi:hypothetical protein